LFPQGYLIYAAFNFIALAVVMVTLFVGLIYYIFKMFTCCCGKKELPQEDQEVVTNKVKMSLGITSVVLLMIMFILSTSMGNYALSEKSKGLVDIPRGFQDISTNLEPELTELVRDSVATVMVPGVVALNHTINSGVNIAETVQSMKSLNASFDELPDIAHMINLLNEIRNLTEGNSTQDRIDDLLQSLDDFESIQSDTNALMDSLESFLHDVNASLVGFWSAVEYANQTINAAEVLMDHLLGTGSSTGLVNEVNDDLVAIQRSPAGSLPSSATFDEVSDGSYGTTPRLIAGVMNAAPAEITVVNDRLIAIYGNLSTLPNFTETATKIIELNDTTNDALSPNGVLNNITRALQMLQNEVVSFPDISAPQSDLTSFYNTLVSSLADFEDGIDSLDVLIAMFARIPSDLNYLLGVIDNLGIVEDIRHALLNVKKQLDAVNTTIIELPSGLGVIHEAFEKFNSSLVDISDETEGMKADIRKANDTVVGYLADGDGYMADMADVLDTINGTLLTSAEMSIPPWAAHRAPLLETTWPLRKVIAAMTTRRFVASMRIALASQCVWGRGVIGALTPAPLFVRTM
jgi:hypothetical protein